MYLVKNAYRQLQRRSFPRGGSCGFAAELRLFPQVDPAFVGLQGVRGDGVVIAQCQPGTGDVEAGGSLEPLLFAGEGADDEQLLAGILPGIHVELFGILFVLEYSYLHLYTC